MTASKKLRHITVDTEGFLLIPYANAADVNDRTALEKMADVLEDKFPSLKKLWADRGYQGKNLNSRLQEKKIDLEIVKRPNKYFWVPKEVKDITACLKEKGIEIVEVFKVIPRHWVVERTFAWISHYRRMSKNYEFLCQT